MTALRAKGRRLLTEEAAAEAAGVDVEAIRRWTALGLLEPVDTPVGDRYALHELRAVLEGAWERPRRTEYLTPQQAAGCLGVGVATLTRKAEEGCVSVLWTPERKRRYEAGEIRAIAAKRQEPGYGWWWPPPRKTN